MRENRTSGTGRGAPGNRRSYRETGLSAIPLVGRLGLHTTNLDTLKYWSDAARP